MAIHFSNGNASTTTEMEVQFVFMTEAHYNELSNNEIVRRMNDGQIILVKDEGAGAWLHPVYYEGKVTLCYFPTSCEMYNIADGEYTRSFMIPAKKYNLPNAY